MTDILQQYPATVEQRFAQLQEIRTRLYKELNESTDVSTHKPAERWSIDEIAYHLHIVESMITMLMKGGLASGKVVERMPDDKLEVEWQRVSTRAGNREVRFEAPDMAVPRNAPSLAESIKLLEQSRTQLLAALENVTLDQLASLSAPHPAKEMGDISGAGWLTLLGWHELRHIDQIRELKASLAQSA